MNARSYRVFVCRDAAFRIACDRFDVVTEELVRQRNALEAYVLRDCSFLESLEPVKPLPGAPEVAVRMAHAAEAVGVGPMAAVAGVMAQLAAEAARKAGAFEVIVDNGGDVYLCLRAPARVVIDAGRAAIAARLAFLVRPEETPLAICSSSGRMGRSLSLGACDLATVVAPDAGLADAAATQAANLVRREDDVPRALERIAGIRGVSGVLIAQGSRVGMIGRLPRVVRSSEA